MELTNLQRLAAPAIRVLYQFKFLILACVTFCTLGGVIFALMTPKVYQASQPFLVRDEISGQIMKPGRFESLEAMKSAQETIQEITKNPEVLRAALKEVGPTNWFAKGDFPTYEDIESFRDNVWISAANGSELGKTEVIHLNVRATSRERAHKLIQLIADGVRQQLREVRSRRAASIEAELNAALDTAEDHLQEITDRVVAVELELGEDLGELRSMDSPYSNDGTLRPALARIKTELLTAQSRMAEVQQQLVYFNKITEDQEFLAGVPSELLTQFPALGELKLGLVRTQLELAKTAGKYNSNSPQHQQLCHEIEEIKVQILNEIKVAASTTEAQTDFIHSHVEALTKQQEQIRERLRHLAKLRAPYNNLLEEMKVASEQFRMARSEYSEAVALQNGSEHTDLITQLEEAQVGSNPVSLSRSNVVLGSLGGGMFISLGLVMLLSAPGAQVSPSQLERLAAERDRI